MNLEMLSSLREEFLKIAAVRPPPLPAAANPMAQAFFGGAKKSDVFKHITAPPAAGKNPLLSKLVKRGGARGNLSTFRFS